MLKKIVPLCLLAVLLVSCATSNYVNSNPVVTSTTLSVEEKFDKLGYEKVSFSNINSFYSGADWAKEFKRLIDNAQNYILLTTFMASECDQNREIYDALIAKAESGVKIYLVCDGVSLLDATETKEYMRPVYYLRNHGVKVFEYNPIKIKRLINPVNMLFREHRKIVVVDGHISAVGGMNMNYAAMITPKQGGDRDSMYCIESAGIAGILKKQFVDYWNTISYENLDIDSLVDVKVEENKKASAWVVNQYLNKTTMPSLIASLFYSAKEEILILPFCPVYDKDMIKWSEDAVNRGVYVELLETNDPRPTLSIAANYASKGLKEAGINVKHEYLTEETAQLLHEKLFIIDSRYVVIGSVNFNHRSMTLSQEVAIVIDDQELASVIKEHYCALTEPAYVVTDEMAQDYQNLINSIIYFVMYYGG